MHSNVLAPRVSADSTLVEAARDGDDGAFGELYRRHFDTLRRYCLRFTGGDHAAAADAAQDAFVRAHGALATLEDPHRFTAWLCTIARRESIRAIERQTRVTPVETVPEPRVGAATLRTDVDRDDQRRLLTEAAEGLNPPDRELLGHLLAGLSGPELASAIGVSTTASVRSRTHRLRARLHGSLATLVVARHGQHACDQLAHGLRHWDGAFRPGIRQRLAQHIEDCPKCRRTRARLMRPEAFLAVLPAALLALPEQRPEPLPVPTAAGSPEQNPLFRYLGAVAVVGVIAGAVAVWQGQVDRPEGERLRTAPTEQGAVPPATGGAEPPAPIGPLPGAPAPGGAPGSRPAEGTAPRDTAVTPPPAGAGRSDAPPADPPPGRVVPPGPASTAFTLEPRPPGGGEDVPVLPVADTGPARGDAPRPVEDTGTPAAPVEAAPPVDRADARPTIRTEDPPVAPRTAPGSASAPADGGQEPGTPVDDRTDAGEQVAQPPAPEPPADPAAGGAAADDGPAAADTPPVEPDPPASPSAPPPEAAAPLAASPALATPSPTTAPEAPAPTTPVPATPAPTTSAPATPAPATPAPATPAPATPTPVTPAPAPVTVPAAANPRTTVWRATLRNDRQEDRTDDRRADRRNDQRNDRQDNPRNDRRNDRRAERGNDRRDERGDDGRGDRRDDRRGGGPDARERQPGENATWKPTGGGDEQQVLADGEGVPYRHVRDSDEPR